MLGGFFPGGRSGKKREAQRAAHPSPTRVGVIPRRLTSAGARAVAKLLAGGVIFVKSPLTQTEQAAETDTGGANLLDYYYSLKNSGRTVSIIYIRARHIRS